MKRIVGVLGILTAIIISSITTSIVSGQGTSAPPLAITAYNGTAPDKPYTAPKTPWGDPDLQGVWSSDDTQGIPMQRPQNISGLYQSEELWAARQKQTQAGIQRFEICMDVREQRDQRQRPPGCRSTIRLTILAP